MQSASNSLMISGESPQHGQLPLRLRGGSDIQPDSEQTTQPPMPNTKAACCDIIQPIEERPTTDDVSIQNENQKSDSFSNNDVNNNPKANSSLDVAKQLEKWSKVRESLYCQYGWSSENVNQNSKWDVDTVDRNTIGPALVDTGTDHWENCLVLGENRTWKPDLMPTDFPADGIVSDENRIASGFGGAIPKSFTNRFDNKPSFSYDSTPHMDSHSFDTNIGSIAKSENPFDLYPEHKNQVMFNNQYRDRDSDQSHQWKSVGSNLSRYPRAITKKNSKELPIDGNIDAMPQFNTSEQSNTFTLAFQNLNLLDSSTPLPQSQQQSMSSLFNFQDDLLQPTLPMQSAFDQKFSHQSQQQHLNRSTSSNPSFNYSLGTQMTLNDLTSSNWPVNSSDLHLAYLSDNYSFNRSGGPSDFASTPSTSTSLPPPPSSSLWPFETNQNNFSFYPNYF